MSYIYSLNIHNLLSNSTRIDVLVFTFTGGVSGDDEDEPSSSDSSGSAASLRKAFCSRSSKPPPSASRRRKLDFNNNLEVEIPGMMKPWQLFMIVQFLQTEISASN